MGRRPVPCPECGELYGGQGKVCMACHKAELARQRRERRTCPECGGYKHRQSGLCRDCFDAQRSRPENYVTKPCPVCGEMFTVHKVHIERGQGIYCSRSCAGSGSPRRKRDRATVTCATCGQEFEKHHSEIRKNAGDLHFCSPDCWYEHNQGENHYGFTGTTPERQAFTSSREWKAVAKRVWRRDRATCQRCGVYSHDHEGQFHIHHIVSFAVEELRAELSNLVLLCDRCHWWVHSNDNTDQEWIEEYAGAA